MNIALFIVVFGLGCSALALWTDVRFPKRRPSEFRQALIHIVAAWAIATFFSVRAMNVLSDAGHSMIAVMVIGLATTVYCLLAMVWLMRVCAEALGKSRGLGESD
jgi:hypothetical protein